MMKRICTLSAFVLFLASCGSDTKYNSKTEPNVYGGTLRVNENDAVQTLYPPGITDVYSAHVATQIYEGLLKLDAKELSLQPCLAEKWEVDSSGLVYTFHIKKGIVFHDDICFPHSKGREVKASDFKYSFEQLCTSSPDNYSFEITFKNRVLGADKFYERTEKDSLKGVEGIIAADDYTLQLKLTSRDNSFPYILATVVTSVFPKEAVELYGIKTKIGTGPFIYCDSKTGETVVLKRNINYHQSDSLGNKLPYLDSVVVTCINDKKKELEAFRQGKLDLIYGLPAESVKDIVEKEISKFKGDSAIYVLDRIPEMITQYYQFNPTRPPFDDPKVRQAFSYAINRNQVIELALGGEAYGPGEGGLCPPALPGYPVDQVTGYKYDAEKGRKLLAEAGYPGGKGFPKVRLVLNSGGNRHTAVAFEVQKQLTAELGITIDIDIVSMKQKMEEIMHDKAELYRMAWVADYPNPENFLWLMYGKNVPAEKDKVSYPNSARYKNVIFDKLFEEARGMKTQKDAYDSFVKAEQVLMNDAPVMVLWYEEAYRLMQATVKNFYGNAMRYRNYSEVHKVTSSPN